MIQEKPEIKDLVALVFDDAAGLDRGDVIPLGRIEELTGCLRYQSEHWTSIVKKLKRRFLKERNIELRSAPGVGYKLSTKHEQLVDNPRSRERRVVRQYNRAVFALQSLPPDELTTHQQAARAQKIRAMVQARRMAKRHMREQETLLKPTQTVFAAARKG